MGEELYILEMPVDDMFPLLETANFMEIKDFVRLMVKAVALQIQGKKAADICEETFGTGIYILKKIRNYTKTKVQMEKLCQS